MLKNIYHHNYKITTTMITFNYSSDVENFKIAQCFKLCIKSCKKYYFNRHLSQIF